MIEQGEFYLAMIGLFVLYIILSVRSDAKLLDLLEELAFPSDDPIMTSELDRGKPVFDYTTIEEEEEEIPLDDTPEEAVELTPEEEEVIEEVMAKEEPEVFSYEETKPEIFTEGLEPKEESELRKAAVAASILYEVGNYTESGEATLRQIKGMRKDDVIGICEIHGLDTEGTKAQLIERIKENAA